ncbi:MAG: hypothetical protein IT373_04785, partial [Polyangiaceae bacterium]|nr:hypothetical protein [Polyangiaceae bacterium]
LDKFFHARRRADASTALRAALADLSKIPVTVAGTVPPWPPVDESNPMHELRDLAWRIVTENRSESSTAGAQGLVLSAGPIELRIQRVADDVETTWSQAPVAHELSFVKPLTPERRADIERRLGEIGREMDVHRSRLGLGPTDQAPSSGVIDWKCDAGKPGCSTYSATQGGGLSASAEWRIADAQAELRSLGAERERLEAELGAADVKQTVAIVVNEWQSETTTKAQYDVRASRMWEVKDPSGPTSSFEQVIAGVRKDWTGLGVADIAEALTREMNATTEPARTVLGPPLLRRIASATSGPEAEQEAALLRQLLAPLAEGAK